MKLLRTTLLALFCLPLAATTTFAGPGYEQDRKELEAVMNDLIAWFPGVWDSYPQIYYERNFAMPKGGVHEHWHRTFVRIDAPQVGEVVFYGQVNVDGRDGPIIAGSQVLYKAVIDEKLGAVNIFGQGPLDPEKYENLHERPDLWSKVQMRDPGALNCDFIWRRDGAQLFGVLHGNTPEKQKFGPGTCAFISKRSEAEFRADAEWVLTPDQLWLYDNNWMADMLFLGREDQTHIKLYRATPYDCSVKDAKGTRNVKAYDRGYKATVASNDGKDLELLVLRAAYPATSGLQDRLRLMITDTATKTTLASADAAALAPKISLSTAGIAASCKLSKTFEPMHKTE